MWYRSVTRQFVGYVWKRTLTEVSPRYIVHSYNLPSTSIKVPIAEKGVDVGMLGEIEFKKHLHERQSARLASIEDDRDIFDLDKDGRPLDGKLYRDDVIVNFLQNHLSFTINKSEAFRGVVNTWYEESLSFHQDLKNLPCSSLDEDYEEKVLELIERSNDAIKVLVDTLHDNKGAIHFKDLFSILIATSLWPQRLTYHKKMRNGAPTKTQYLFQNLIQRLDDMSMDRITNFSPTKNPYFMRDPWKRLIMAKAWMHVLTNDLGGKVHGPIYPYNLLYKVASDSGKNSTRFFSKFDPATMVDLAKILLRLKHVPEDFHKYYALFKFYEFINCFSLEEIALICRAFQNHAIKVLGDHPLNSALQTVVLNRLCDSMETVDDNVFTIIDDFFRLKSLNNFNRFEEFQEKAMNCPNLGLSSLIRVLRRSDSTVCALNGDLIQKITDLILNDINTIAFVDCLLLQRLITRNVFTNDVAFKLNTRLLKLMEEKDGKHLAEEKIVVLPFILLQFAYQGFFSEVLCNQLKNDGRLFAQNDDKKVELKNNILRGELKEQRSIRAAIGIIDGLGKYHGKDFLNISDKTTNTLIDYLSKWSPSLSKKDKQKKGFFDRMDHWDIIGSQSPQIILEKAGFLHQYVEADYVAETSILPFLGSADYVFCLDSSNNIVPLPKTFKDQLLERGDIKKISNEPDLQWCVLSLITPRMGFMNGAISDSTLSVYKIIHDLGYRAYVYNFTNDENTEDEVVLNELKSFIGDIFTPRLRDKTL